LKFGHDDVRDVIERASARETAARVAAGAVAKALLRAVGTEVRSETRTIGEVSAMPTFDSEKVEASEVRCADAQTSARMVAAIAAAREAGDTLGGIVALRATGVVPGLGSFAEWDRRLDGRIAQALLSIQAAKGMQFADAFTAATERGSAVHDPITVREGHFSRTRNRAGGPARGSARSTQGVGGQRRPPAPAPPASAALPRRPARYREVLPRARARAALRRREPRDGPRDRAPRPKELQGRDRAGRHGTLSGTGIGGAHAPSAVARVDGGGHGWRTARPRSQSQTHARARPHHRAPRLARSRDRRYRGDDG